MVILDRFNARDLSASEVASTFVVPPQFGTLCRGNNSLLLGPRGSGKTTLLKMLTPEATESRGIGSSSDVSRPEFLGVYIPLDVQLAESLERISTSGFDPQLRAIGAEALFALHSFRRIAVTASWFCGSSIRRSKVQSLAPDAESGLVNELASLWSVSPDVPTIHTLLAVLRRQQVQATQDWRQAILAEQLGERPNRDEMRVVDLDSGLKGGLEALSRHIPWAAPRLAVLFDEVELAPDSLQTLLLSYLRHSEEGVLFKLAISPYMGGAKQLSDRVRASPMNDYDPVDLGSFDSERLRDFSEDFFVASALRRGLGPVSLVEALGPSALNPVPIGRNSDAVYKGSSFQARKLRSLAQKDGSFADYLEGLGADLGSSASGVGSDELAPFRKVRQVALLRESFLSDVNASGRRIKTKNDSRRLYTGAETVVKICEGNPRRLSFIYSLLLDGLSSDGRVPRGVQMAAVDSTQAAFKSFLRGLRVSKEAALALPRGVLSFLDLLGQIFHDEIVSAEFNPDPVGSFTVHSSASELVEEIVARAVNAGALVQLSSADERGLGAVSPNMAPVETSRGKRFRLSFLLSPGYGLPVRVSRQRSLETLLHQTRESKSGAKKRSATSMLDGQGKLL
jgi:energy-coupling factor transporter ATP-binding protein EcfA2